MDVERQQGRAEQAPGSFVDQNVVPADADQAPVPSSQDEHASDDGASSQEGDENAVVNCESATLLPTMGSTPGRTALGVLQPVQNVLEQVGAFNSGGHQAAMQLGPAIEPLQDVEKRQNVDPVEPARELQGELDRVTALAEEGERDLTLARSRIDELQEECKQLMTQLEGVQSGRASDVRRLQSEIAALRRQLAKKEQVCAAWSRF